MLITVSMWILMLHFCRAEMAFTKVEKLDLY